MSTKQVSVRLSATGGRQVRAELEGVGAAGARGFCRLTREMDAANRSPLVIVEMLPPIAAVMVRKLAEQARSSSAERFNP